MASVLRAGRGQFRIGARNEQAHRVAWELTYGSPPPGMLRTQCGDLRCVRPDHQIVADRYVGPVNLARTPAKRFEVMVSKGPDCWLWTGSTDHFGYGQFLVIPHGEGRRMVRAHRFAWELAYGAIRDGADVLHRCDTRLCVRPDHLVIRLAGEAPGPTLRQLALLRACLRGGPRRGSLSSAAAEAGIRYTTAWSHMSKLRARLGVATNDEAAAWLDEHSPGWR